MIDWIIVWMLVHPEAVVLVLLWTILFLLTWLLWLLIGD